MAVLVIALALGLAGFLQYLIEPAGVPQDPGPRPSNLGRIPGFLLLAALALVSLSWPAAQWRSGPGQFAPMPSLLEILARTGAALAFGALGFSLVTGSLRASGAGILAALLFSASGYYSCRWLSAAVGFKLLGNFAGSFLWTALPPVQALGLALAGLALLHSEFILNRWGLILGLALAWSAPAHLAEWRLKSAWGYGPRTLAQAAGIGSGEGAERVAVAWLKPEGGASYRIEERRIAAQGLDLSVESLEKLYLYLKGVRYRSVFTRPALGALRRGWLLWWDSERALEAHMLASPGLAAPDYRTALSLIRAGPLTAQRYRKLQELSELAKPRREGFEDVNQAQRIFEAFASAYARFGDEEHARSWLYKVDNLWPIYEKKIEVSPLESFHVGSIAGSVLRDGAPASSVMVGLFYVSSSSAAKSGGEGVLSSGDVPDASGKFEFLHLGIGRYYLGLMGHPAQFAGRILNSPGIIQITEEEPSAGLPPVLIEGR